jgi:hypothetical protein
MPASKKRQKKKKSVNAIHINDYRFSIKSLVSSGVLYLPTRASS